MIDISQTLASIKMRQPNPIIWEKSFGRMHYRNNILPAGDLLYFGTSGDKWNFSDPNDAILCVRQSDGEVVWRVQTDSDVNGIAIFDSVLVAGTDSGMIYALNIADGRILSRFQAGSPVYTKAVIVDVEGERIAVLLSRDGHIICFNLADNSFRHTGSLPGTFRTNIVTNPELAETGSVLAANEAGTIFQIGVGTFGSTDMERFTIPVTDSSGPYHFKLRLQGIGSLLFHENLLIVTYARETYDERPPILALDWRTWKVAWNGHPRKTVSKKKRFYFGNCRIHPVISNGEVLATFAYSDSLYAFSITTGRCAWSVRVDNDLFQNWASPVLMNRRTLAVPRANGVIAFVDLQTRRVIRSISLETPSNGQAVDELDYSESLWPDPGSSEMPFEGPGPGQILTSGLASTPVYSGGQIIVGTISGKLVALKP
ncbi:PQQ-binding-like beta-propeller repeat protein [Aquabacter cavernae]|uniref:outer membrane protein assembly factor BamB family protein n=1 Tax=Aquabacter cavernae TaxID=2496029 RepID=UPI000F8CF758|nr:PQQ-binding-like beta-propeller repeat protein [Aquabacter cavernae]